MDRDLRGPDYSVGMVTLGPRATSALLRNLGLDGPRRYLPNQQLTDVVLRTSRDAILLFAAVESLNVQIPINRSAPTPAAAY